MITGWYLDSPFNRHIVGGNWIARDWFPEIMRVND